MSAGLYNKLSASVISQIHREGFRISAIVDEDGTTELPVLSDFHKLDPSMILHWGAEGTVILKTLHKARDDIQKKRQDYPGFGPQTTDIIMGGAGTGYLQHFQNGSVFWTEVWGAHVVYGDIRDKYASLGWERSYLGYPTTDEISMQTPQGEVRYNNFEHGNISWTPARRAFIPLSLSAYVERHSLGAWIHLSGTGFTPGGTVRFTVEGLEGRTTPLWTGVMAFPLSDGTFKGVVWDGRTWERGGVARIRAHDEASGQSDSQPIPALH